MICRSENTKLRHGNKLALFACAVLTSIGGCTSLQTGLQHRFLPSNDRDWSPELARLPYAESDGDEITIHNIRNCNYVTSDDFVVRYYDRTISLGDVQSVDFIVVPFKQTSALAHTMISFGLRDGSYLGVSVEVRKEKGETYSLISGLTRQFEIIYVVADERDLIRLRTRYRDDDVYVYPTIATAEQSQKLFLEVTQRLNQLSMEPEFYDSLRNNCTTNLVHHVNHLSPDRIANGWRVMLPGFSARYAYDLGLLDQSIPFEDLTALALVNDLADVHFDDEQFSQWIRAKRRYMDGIVSRQQSRSQILDGSGQQYLTEQTVNRPRIWR